MALGRAVPPPHPARPGRPLLRPPKEMPKRRAFGSMAGRIALVHALAHIELNAIDLGWDLVARFSGQKLPHAFFDDWVSVATEEALMFLLSLALATALPSAELPRTLRLDYFHIGTAQEEHFALRGLALEGPWPGSLLQTIDETNFGSYFFEVRDVGTNRVLYSRGYSSIFDEWEDTSEAKQRSRGFSESLRFPLPRAPFQVISRTPAGAHTVRAPAREVSPVRSRRVPMMQRIFVSSAR